MLVSGAAVEATGPNSSASREFVQTFLLGKDPVEGGYYIRNTVVRFLGPAAVVTITPAQAPEIALLQGPWIEIRECVDGAHLRAALEQQLAQVGADESRATRHQCLH